MKSILTFTTQILPFIFLCVRGDRDSSLTTAVVRDGISGKPTAFYRWIDVDKYVVDRNTPEIFFNKEIMRRQNIDVWSWDLWCQLQLQKGNCTKKRQKYYYNSQLDQCLQFTYSGCEGNKNNFDTIVECERHCKGATFMEVKNIGRSTSCTLQPNSGLCAALYDRYYYDVNARTCKSFKFSGCGGNKNRFALRHKCLEKCGDTEDN